MIAAIEQLCDQKKLSRRGKFLMEIDAVALAYSNWMSFCEAIKARTATLRNRAGQDKSLKEFFGGAENIKNQLIIAIFLN